MSCFLIPTSSLTENDLEKRGRYIRSRNLFNKYTVEQLEKWIKVDLYEALDLEAYRNTDIPLDILDYASRKKSAMYHPVKNRGKEQGFLVIKKAQTVLSSPRLRRVYDSCFLDESLPEDREYAPDEFFKVFSDVFDRNGLFSEVKPVPRLSDDVETFYRFWQGFRTTRVYDDPGDVFDVSGSSRRYAAEKNREAMQQKRVKDLQRIQELVKLSIKLDPRIKKRSVESSAWDDAQIKSLVRFNTLLGKVPNRFETIAKKLNDIYVTKRTSAEVKSKVESLRKR